MYRIRTSLTQVRIRTMDIGSELLSLRYRIRTMYIGSGKWI